MILRDDLDELDNAARRCLDDLTMIADFLAVRVGADKVDREAARDRLADVVHDLVFDARTAIKEELEKTNQKERAYDA